MIARSIAFILPLAALALTGCDYVSSVGNDTEMKNVEILPGTASDEMVTLDSANGDGTAIDPSTAVGPAQPKPTAAEEAADEAMKAKDAENGDDSSSNGDTVVRPPAGGAEPDRPAAPARPATPAPRPAQPTKN